MCTNYSAIRLGRTKTCIHWCVSRKFLSSFSAVGDTSKTCAQYLHVGARQRARSLRLLLARSNARRAGEARGVTRGRASVGRRLRHPLGTHGSKALHPRRHTRGWLGLLLSSRRLGERRGNPHDVQRLRAVAASGTSRASSLRALPSLGSEASAERQERDPRDACLLRDVPVHMQTPRGAVR